MSAAPRDLAGLRRADADRAPAATAVAAPPARWRTRVLLPGVIGAIVIALLLVTSARTLLPATPVRVVPVVVKTVEGAAGTVTVQAPGWLEPDPHPDYVAALADGVVAEVLVLEGDRVEAGQVVARLVDDDARLALEGAEAVLEERRARLAAAEADATATRLVMEHLIDRAQTVAAGEARVAEMRAEIERVRADGAVEQARLMEIRDEYDRKSKLTESQAVSEATVARLRLRLDAQRAAVEATEAQRGVLDARLARARADLRAAKLHHELLIEERRDVALAEAAVDTARAAVAIARAARDEAALRLERMRVRAPVAGIVMRRLASPGSKLTREGGERSAHVVHLYDPRRLQVRVDVPLADAAHVVLDQPVEVAVDVLPDRTFTGSVTRLVHEADIQKNTVEVKVGIDEPASVLKPEMLARVRFLAQAAGEAPGATDTRQRLFAPSSLIRRDDGEQFVWVVSEVVDGRGRAERRRVVPGRRQLDGWREIDEGLRPGDLLIAEPSSGLEPGERVRIAGETP